MSAVLRILYPLPVYRYNYIRNSRRHIARYKPGIMRTRPAVHNITHTVYMHSLQTSDRMRLVLTRETLCAIEACSVPCEKKRDTFLFLTSVRRPYFGLYICNAERFPHSIRPMELGKNVMSVFVCVKKKWFFYHFYRYCIIKVFTLLEENILKFFGIHIPKQNIIWNTTHKNTRQVPMWLMSYRRMYFKFR